MANLCLCILLFFIPYVAASQTVIKFLPGYEGPLPFYLETGYVGVGESDTVQLFYYFIKSERNPKDDPLLLWLTGGPRCSVLSGLVYEIGPIKFKKVEYNGSLPTFVLNPYSWTKVSSIIFVDSPVGTGFSYAKIPSAAYSNDTLQIQNLYEFVRKWLINHPEFLSNKFYVSGDSQTGKIVPGIVQDISNGNEYRKPLINVQGYILGNPLTDDHRDFSSRIPYAHGVGLISDELFESLKESCQGEYVNVDPNNTYCLHNVEAYDKGQILELNYSGVSRTRRSLYNLSEFLDLEGQKLSITAFDCREYAYLLSEYWANDDEVRDALHIRKGSIGSWRRCDMFSPYYDQNLKSTFPYHVNLSTRSYRSLIYSGDHDLRVPNLGTQAWIRKLNYSIIDDWRPWIVEGQIAGYTRTYSNRMTFATIKGGGHTAPEYKPRECFEMIKRWLSHKTL